MGCHFLLQGIFLTQGETPSLLHWQADSLPPSHSGSCRKPDLPAPGSLAPAEPLPIYAVTPPPQTRLLSAEKEIWMQGAEFQSAC